MSKGHLEAQSGSWEQSATWYVIGAFTIAIPLIVSPLADDVFRVPKDLLLRAEAIIVSALLAVRLITAPHSVLGLRQHRAIVTLVSAAVVVAAITYGFSVNRGISEVSLSHFAACTAIFCATYFAAKARTLTASISLPLCAAVPNALMAVAQRLHWWNPFVFDPMIPDRLKVTALVGNPNDVGAYLSVCAIAAVVLAVVRRKPAAILVFAILLAGVIAADALTAILAIGASLFALSLRFSRRPVATVALGALTFLLAFFSIPSLRLRSQALLHAARTHDYQVLTSRRIVGWTVALDIFMDHPIVGAGPGTFKWLYLPYRLQVEQRHPEYYLRSLENLGEAHSDHLQILAEEGLLGYGLLVLTLTVFVRSLSHARSARETSRFARLLSLPLVVCFVILAIAGFPLELSAVTTTLLFLSACTLRWGHYDASD